MTSVFKSVLKPLLLAGLMAGAGFSALAQTTPAGPGGDRPGMMNHGRMGHGPRDPAKMQEMMAKHQGKGREAMRAEMEKLSTPERIDKMKALRAQRDAEMDKRATATKTFYAALTPEQQKVFDAQHMRGGHGAHHGGDRGARTTPPAKP
jgi:protein CpxP